MSYTREELAEARWQIESTLHKLRQVVKTLEGKEDPVRYKSQIALAERCIRAFAIAEELIARELNKISCERKTARGPCVHGLSLILFSGPAESAALPPPGWRSGR